MENSKKLSDQKLHFLSKDTNLTGNIDKVAARRNNLKTPKFFRRFAPEMCRIWRKFHFQRSSPNIHIWEHLGVKLKIKFSKRKTNN
jgi:hypothetical protein